MQQEHLFRYKVVNHLLFLLILFGSCSLGESMRIEKSAYHDIIIDIREAVPANYCSVVLENLEITLRTASDYLFTSLDGRAYFGSVIVNLPDTWPDACIPNNSTPPAPSLGGKSDLTVTATNLLYGDRIWTQQSGGCGVGGDQVYIPYRSLEGKNAAKEFVKEWAKYRYGIFDEIGFYDDRIYPQCHFTDSMHVTGCSDGSIKDVGLCTNPNPYADMVKTLNKTARTSLMYVPQGEGVTMFCDEGTHDRYAPTKHNLLCDRKSTLEVILRHSDFAPSNLATVSSTTITNTIPVFHYRRRVTSRYMLVIDETQEILLRESWSFLRNAVRKWVVYDLTPNCEVGIVLAGGVANGKVLPITKMDMQKNRDLVASFVPYAPSDSRQAACVGCAIRKSLDILEERRKKHGNASHIVVILAPGMDFATDYNELAAAAVSASARIVTINFPSIVRRQPLDKLATHSAGIAFTVHERKYNSEKSYLDTYFELAEVFFHISQEYHEGPAYQKTVEIHRKELLDVSSEFAQQSKRASRVIQGTFFLDGRMGNPSGFFIYTHNSETPLIQNVRLTSPTGSIYNTRSDQRMPVKQLTVLANINETGPWAYMIERFNGNPQPHFVQVMATPESESVNIVRARAWAHALQAGGLFIVYCEVKRGDYPVHSAHVRVTITRPDVPCNYTVCEDTYNLLDTGAGDPDITKGDGVYSRYVNIDTGPGLYKFDIFVDDNGNTAYSLQDNAAVQNLPCCGSVIPTKQTRQTVPFQRYLPPLAFHLTREDIDTIVNIPVGRIGDLIVTYLQEGKVRLTWTTPDMGGESVARYEIKFAFTIEDIVDRYETAAIMWNHETPYPYAIGDICSFILDINLEERLFGQAVFFAIRPFSKLAPNAIGGPTSNPVRTYIPSKVEPTPEPPPPSSPGFLPDENDSDFDTDAAGNSTPTGDEIDIRVMYSIPIIAGTLCILSLIGIFYLVTCYRRVRERKEQLARLEAAKQDGDLNELQNEESNSAINSNQSSPKNSNSGSSNHPSGNESSSMHGVTTTIVHNYATLDIPDHHTVGIPVYNNQEELQGKRVSMSGSFNGIAPINTHDYHINDSRPVDVANAQSLYAPNCSIGGLSIISAHSENAIVPRGPAAILSPYDTWTASQLLHENERRPSPLDELMNHINLQHNLHTADQINNSIDAMSLNGCGPPPVPPLPYAPDIYQHFPYPYVYGTMPKQHNDPLVANYSTIRHPPTEQQQQQQQQQHHQQHQQQQQQQLQQQAVYNNNNNNNIHQQVVAAANNETGDKKRRNITMV